MLVIMIVCGCGSVVVSFVSCVLVVLGCSVVIGELWEM